LAGIASGAEECEVAVRAHSHVLWVHNNKRDALLLACRSVFAFLTIFFKIKENILTFQTRNVYKGKIV
jgi:hypothetical protein